MALVELQVRVELLPEVMDVGLAEIVTVGGGLDDTVTVAEAGLDVPPVPEQVRV